MRRARSRVSCRICASVDSGMAPADLCIGKVDPGIPFAVPRNGKVDPVISLANSKSDYPDPELARVIKSSAFSIFGPRPAIFGSLPRCLDLAHSHTAPTEARRGVAEPVECARPLALWLRCGESALDSRANTKRQRAAALHDAGASSDTARPGTSDGGISKMHPFGSLPSIFGSVGSRLGSLPSSFSFTEACG